MKRLCGLFCLPLMVQRMTCHRIDKVCCTTVLLTGSSSRRFCLFDDSIRVDEDYDCTSCARALQTLLSLHPCNVVALTEVHRQVPQEFDSLLTWPCGLGVFLRTVSNFFLFLPSHLRIIFVRRGGRPRSNTRGRCGKGQFRQASILPGHLGLHVSGMQKNTPLGG